MNQHHDKLQAKGGVLPRGDGSRGPALPGYEKESAGKVATKPEGGSIDSLHDRVRQILNGGKKVN
jgi:hypothetical protein